MKYGKSQIMGNQHLMMAAILIANESVKTGLLELSTHLKNLSNCLSHDTFLHHLGKSTLLGILIIHGSISMSQIKKLYI